jgi:hypothetical protein
LNLGIKNIKKWRDERPTKSLVELQIEVSERALAEVALASKELIPARGKEHIRGTINEWLSQLTKSKKALHFRILTDGFEMFDAEEAELLRKSVKEQ